MKSNNTDNLLHRIEKQREENEKQIQAMKHLTCPLALPAEIVLADLSAESLRSTASAFSNLAYTPQEAETVKALIASISEHARMGFTQIQVGYELSEQLTKSLRDKGLWVQVSYKAQVRNLGGNYSDYKPLTMSWPEASVSIGWSEPEPERTLNEGHFATRDEAKSDGERQEAEILAEWRKLCKERVKQAEDRLKKAAEYPKERHTVHAPAPGSGCFPLLLIGAAITYALATLV